MDITDIRIRKINFDSKMKAIVSVTFDDSLVVHDIKVIEGADKLFVAMPSRRDENGVFRDIVHPISPSSRQLLEGTILDAYSRQLAMIEAEECKTQVE